MGRLWSGRAVLRAGVVEVRDGAEVEVWEGACCGGRVPFLGSSLQSGSLCWSNPLHFSMDRLNLASGPRAQSQHRVWYELLHWYSA
eukprot:CAMPEP_0169479046 /NCGR_PEP_ID=MMETSP1042-20121227/28806_1 /TAXON_ID=464988 /ORGANISM="Hemiselmis andersenii, Strain CCMP1180" /LENGTH=85 /DNA_ID=CAMNT_0009593567 /DNA_START=16 /DNA_END=270 /DNA_ORIENTATION=+